jgi:CubicO group peptidase (beta-lactamase class C family)
MKKSRSEILTLKTIKENKMKKITALILCLTILPIWISGQQKGFVKGKIGEQIDDLMINFSKEGYSGSVLVVMNGDTVLHKGYGWADRERKIQNLPQTLFNVASVGKTFTAAAVLKLETQGKLKTSDPISKYLGQFPKDKNEATIHHLLTHTAGLTVQGATLDYSSRKAFVQSVKDTPMESKPGEKYRYTNAGYTLLAAIVEEVSGVPFENYLQKNIFSPANLTSTGYAWDAKFKNAPVAVGYTGDKLEELKPTEREKDVWGNRGPGNQITTVGDLYKWIQALQKNLVLSKQAKNKMFTAYAHGDEGYGWHVIKTARNTTMVRRGGGRPDFESEVQWYIDENTVIIFTVNNDLNLRRRIAPAIEQIVWSKPSNN